ncbi:hypothetical protein GCM10012284_03150 [Mangrovihabitans endophyticus]|uniref:Amino acid adenylation domain-containing protein n=2 Tax=Mangrovihabitans endophyticus TaxID=1751298 RepID=A0A8J3BW25_9ACTN|nr:hypothetical protein GCM10012284_03150 [Mangrovihabitans endophyticus]
MAVRILSQCRRVFGVELPLRALGPGVPLSGLLDSMREHGGDPAEPASTAAAGPQTDATGGDVVLTPGMQALASLRAIAADEATYHVVVELTIAGVLDRERLRRALRLLAERHEALRCTFHVRDGETVGRVAPVAALDYAECATQSEAETEQEVHLAARAPLDLQDRPVRVRLIRAAADRHLLVLTLHHMVCDGLSVRILLRDLTRLYRDDSPGTLPALRHRLSDLASASEARLDGGRRERLAAHWRTAMAGAPEETRLPGDLPESNRPQTRGARVPVVLERDQHLRVLAADCEATLFSVLAAGLALLARTYTEQDDLVIGFPVAGRADPDIQDVVAYLSQMMPLRMRPVDTMTVGELVAQAHDGVVAAVDHADLPFDEIVTAVAPHRTPGRHPLFQVALVLLAGLDDYAAVPGLTFRRRDVPTGTTKFDLSWYVEETTHGLRGYVEFDADRYSTALVERMVTQLGTVLDGMAAGRDLPVHRIPLHTGPDRDRIIAEYAPPADRAPEDGVADDVVAMVERFAAEQPDRPALWHTGDHVSYLSLNGQANRLARVLRRQGVGAEDLVGIHLPRSPDQIAALLAVFKAGAAYLPLDPAYPPDRLRYMAEDAGVRHIVAAGDVPWLSGLRNPPTIIDVSSAGGEPDSTDLRIRPDPAGLAYVIYTSGSTGRPKGVQLTHRALANVIVCSGPDFGIDRHTRVLQFVSFSFDASVWEIFMALGWGATLCLGPADHADSTQTVSETIRRCGATLIFLTPALLATVEPDEVPSVRLVITGGDRVSANLRDRWLPHSRFFAAYGPTEATIVQTWQECRQDSRADGPPPIGRPFANVRLYVLNRWGDPVPPGAVGEVCIGGLAVGRGYRGRPGQTADRFTPDPYSPVPGARLYHTGDLVRRGESGDLWFVGRLDHQVKIRGYRIEPSEVETVLRRSPEVADAIVRAEAGPSGQARLVAYVQPAANAGDGLGERLRHWLNQSVPQHTVPDLVHLIPVFPLTANGKVDIDLVRALADVSPARLADLLSQVEMPEPAGMRLTEGPPA